MQEVVEAVTVVGSGLGGLTLAACLRSLERPVQVVDARLDSPVAVPDRGLCLWSGALTALARVGLGTALLARAVPIERVQVWSAHGRLLTDFSARDTPVSGVCVRHAALVEVLAAACADVPFISGQQVVAYDEDSRGVVLTCRGGSTLRAPVAVAADGPRSMLRAQCMEDGPPDYSGDTVWQGITVGLRRLDPGIMHLFWASHGVRAGMMAVDRAGNWLWWVDWATGAGSAVADRPSKADLRTLLSEIDGPILDLVEATPESGIKRNDVYARRDPGPGGRGRVALIGDAWHPVPITLRLGGTIAIEDGVLLGESLAGSLPPMEALRAFEHAREPRVAWTTRAVWSLRAFETRFSAPAAWSRDRLLIHLPRSVSRDFLERLLTGEERRPVPETRRRLRWA